MFNRLFPLTLSALVLALGLVAAASPAKAVVAQGGLHTEEWFAVTFKDVAEDIQSAKDEGKRLVLIFEQYGCVYCRKMHEVLLQDPEVRDYIKEHFKVVQLNMFGDEEVTDLDGEVMTEKEAARKWSVVFTPTVMFMPEEPMKDVTAAKAAVATMPGLFSKWTFLHMFEWVEEKGYEGEEHFQKYHARRLDELRKAGKLSN